MICQYINDQLHVENVALADVAAAHGTPCYVYSKQKIVDNYRAYDGAFGSREHSICYAVKANSNIAILSILRELGAGFDVVSVGELERVVAAGGSDSETVFAGVGKMDSEIERALELGVSCFNVESTDELKLINEIAGRVGKRAAIAVRVNPDVDAKTHPYISTGLNENKFGIPMVDAVAVYELAAGMRNIEIIGVACHIGSQLTELTPFVAAAQRVQLLVNTLRDKGIEFEHVDIGGGLGISYGTETTPPIADYVSAICRTIDSRYRIVVEPGRSIVGEAGLLLTKVLFMKQTPAKLFAIVDASMTELIRPALYQAEHPVQTVVQNSESDVRVMDIVGPVCETADFLAKNISLSVSEHDLLAVLDAGAYGAVMASSYNSRPKPAEILVSDGRMHQIRVRDSIESLMANERLPE
ncbi:MAG: diaminopimelate decarboxylase [Gammaproteobacteria bacterium]